MPRELAIAISDVAVAVSAFYSASSLQIQYAKLGFLLIGLAASLGIFRYASERPHSYLTFAHVNMSWIAKLFGMPFLSLAYLEATENPKIDYHVPLLAFSVLTFLVTKFLPKHMKSTPTDAISGLAVLGIALNSYHARMYGIFGAVGYFLGGVALEVDLGKNFMSPIALFHYIITLANVFLTWGLWEAHSFSHAAEHGAAGRDSL